MTGRRAALLRTGGGLAALLLLAGSLAGCAARSSPTAETDPPTAVLHWQARNEKGVYGYLVYRAERREGPFLRISREIVHVPPEAPDVGSYEFVDRDVEPGRTYYYTLDVVRTTGHKSRFSGVLSKTVPR